MRSCPFRLSLCLLPPSFHQSDLHGETKAHLCFSISTLRIYLQRLLTDPYDRSRKGARGGSRRIASADVGSPISVLVDEDRRVAKVRLSAAG